MPSLWAFLVFGFSQRFVAVTWIGSGGVAAETITEGTANFGFSESWRLTLKKVTLSHVFVSSSNKSSDSHISYSVVFKVCFLELCGALEKR